MRDTAVSLTCTKTMMTFRETRCICISKYGYGPRRWSLIDDGAGQIHRVTVGNYVGRNHGRIVQVTENRTDVIEIIPDGEGGWVERPRTLSLKEKTQ